MNLKSKAFFIALLVVLIGGVLGSMSMTAVTAQQAVYAPPIMIVNVSFLNVRTGPAAYYSILTTVVGGSELPVLGVARDLVWYQVSTLAGIGWINSEHAVGRGDFTHVPFVAAPPIEAVPPLTDDDVAALGQGGGGEVPMGSMASSGEGWGVSIVEPHGAIAGAIDSGWTINMNANYDVIYPIMDMGSYLGGVFYRVHDDWAGDIWVDVTKVVTRPFGCNLYVISFPNDVLLGEGPDRSGTDATLWAGNEALILGRQGNLYHLGLMDGVNGWAFVDETMMSVREPGLFPDLCQGVAATTVTTTTDGQTTSTDRTTTAPARRSAAWVFIDTGHLNVRSGPGAQYTTVATVGFGEEYDVTGFAPDGVWYRIRGHFGEGWINSEFVAFRGDGTYIPVIRGVTGVLVRPMAVITNAVTLYAAPNIGMGVIGTLSGPLEVEVVARTEAFDWVQLETSLGFGWVPVNQVQLSGDSSLVPIVGN